MHTGSEEDWGRVYGGGRVAKLDKVEDFSEYGVIIVDIGLAETATYELKDPGGKYSHQIYQGTLRVHAKKGGLGGLVADGVTFIELCRLV